MKKNKNRSKGIKNEAAFIAVEDTSFSAPVCAHDKHQMLYAKKGPVCKEAPITKTSPSCARAHGWTSKPGRAVMVISLLYNTDHHISASRYVGKPGSCCTGDTHMGAAKLQAEQLPSPISCMSCKAGKSSAAQQVVLS